MSKGKGWNSFDSLRSQFRQEDYNTALTRELDRISKVLKTLSKNIFSASQIELLAKANVDSDIRIEKSKKEKK